MLRLALLLIALAGPLQATWIERKAEGWAWYEDKKLSKQKDEEPPYPITQQEKLAEIRKELEEKLALAVLNPTDEHLLDYMIEQKKWLDHSSHFSHLWTKMLLDHPELDPTTTTFPVSQYGIQLRKAMVHARNQDLILQLSKDHGLFFFYEGNSKISQALSIVVKEFSRRNAWEVVAISVDGSILQNYPNTRLDNGIAKSFGIETYPALFIVNPKEKTAVPIAYGLVTLEQIEDNIALQFITLKEEQNG